MMETLLIIVTIFGTALAVDNLEVAYQWKELDFDFPSREARIEAIYNGEFIPENNLPLGLEVHDERVFITVPRWKSGVAASLTYIKMTDPMDSPKLRPYPNWEAHNLSSTNLQIVSPFRIRADKCGRLWVLDTGEEAILEEPVVHRLTTLLIFDLSSDTLMRSYKIPSDQMKNHSFFANIAVEDHECSNTFAYLGDLGGTGMVVYSWKSNTSWKIKHHYFNFDPIMGEFNVSGQKFQWSDGLFGMALSKPDSEGFSTLYFHPLCSAYEFSVNTKFLRENTSDNFHDFKIVGSRGGKKAQSGSSFLDPKTNVLFYTLPNLNAVACWRTTNPDYTMHSQGRVYMNNVTMVFPNDIKVDSNDTLWVLSDRLPKFMYDNLDRNDVNFRIWKAKVEDAIRGTTCDRMVKTNITSRTFGTKSGGSSVGVAASYVLLLLVAIRSL